MNEEVINQDEIDALLGQEGSDSDINPDEPQKYDFINQEQVLKGRVPDFKLIRENFIRKLTTKSIDFIKRKSSVEFIDRSFVKYDEFLKSQFNPTYLSLLSLEPLHGKMLLSMDASLLFNLVENYFGGEGKLEGKNEGREFTPTEIRICDMYQQEILDIYQFIWKEYIQYQMKPIKFETNPLMANFFPENTLMVTYTYKIALEGGAGNLVFAYPFTAMEQISALFEKESNNTPDKIQDKGWGGAIKRETFSVPIEISCCLAKHKTSLKNIFHLKVGDVIPIDIPEESTLTAAGVPIFKGKFGVHEQSYAFKVLRSYQDED